MILTDPEGNVAVKFDIIAVDIEANIAQAAERLENRKVIADKLGKVMDVLEGVQPVVKALGDVS